MLKLQEHNMSFITDKYKEPFVNIKCICFVAEVLILLLALVRLF